ncbi:hypothetical protein BS47DRAFT_1398079 [Hydnum rufescens UP504]|uniref:Uncharacterized protein n=1 Tax=Hydnum rufescens UP504 TaxID=1448309 RepID=A0A9P6ALQ5_9AGAM|nr:hypothetical protein BS47DRAFT_1398079 [Hydnum rufescens UP504]
MSKAVLKRLSRVAQERMGIVPPKHDDDDLGPPSSSSTHPPKHWHSWAKFPSEEIIAEGPSGDILVIDLPYRSPSPNTGGPSEPEASFVPLVLDDTAEPLHSSRIHIATDTRSRHAHGKAAVAIRWNHVVIPSLIQAFMLFEREQLLHQEEHTVHIEEACRCGNNGDSSKFFACTLNAWKPLNSMCAVVHPGLLQDNWYSAVCSHVPHRHAGPYHCGDDELPSLYLQSCCPLCFGGSQTIGLPLQAIVCIDANFQPKRN